MPDIEALNQRFSIPDRVTFTRGPGSLAIAEIANLSAHARIALQGAQILDWAPAGAAPVIWLSPTAKFAEGKAIRGGIPICWPWFGPHPSETTFPAHGFARTSRWEVVAVECPADETTRLLLRLIPSEAVRAWWPHATPAELRVSIGERLSLELVTQNLGIAPIVISEALHTYFAVSDVRTVQVLGLDGHTYIDKVDGGRTKRQQGPLTFSEETDRIYLSTGDEHILVDRSLKRQIRIAKTGSRSTVIWNPWIQKSAHMDDFVESGYVHMLCIEAANAADDAVTLAPGEEHCLGVTYSVESLA